ncbi:hypothetical protein [Erythrobacter sp. MTPC3]|uniref:hypothetical protein n=1 Tax=Erythrobacter sp. MTPC3 TaxID=3056564 RepID=UPI0036F267A0
MADVSILSIAASLLYLLVAFVLSSAALTARLRSQQPWHVRAWTVLAILLVILAAIRVFDVEDTIREHLRESLRALQLYDARRSYQSVIAAGIFALGVAGFIWWFTGLVRKTTGRRNFATIFAASAGGAMILLSAIRITSLHAIDGLLYGPLKLNWFADLGLVLFLAGCALYYLHIVRLVNPAHGSRR